MDWPKLLASRQYCFVAYTGATCSTNTSRWYCVEALERWCDMRYDLETLTAEGLHSGLRKHRTLPYNTFVRGYVWTVCRRSVTVDADVEKVSGLREVLNQDSVPSVSGLVELHGETFVEPNSFMLLVRCPMPLGARPYMPLRRNPRYVNLQQKLEDTAYVNLYTKLPDATEEDFLGPPDPALTARRSKMYAAVAEIQAAMRTKAHAADRPVAHHHVCSLGVRHATAYAVPPRDYECPQCGALGAHYRDACHLWPRKERPAALPFGANKFAPNVITASEADVTEYAIRHNNAMAKLKTAVR